MNLKRNFKIFIGIYLLMILLSLSFMTSFALTNKNEKDFVTPEEYGAVGDGQTDDAPAINAALESGKPVKLGDKTYLTKTSIFMPSNSELYGSDNSKILNDVKSGYGKNIIVAGIAGSNQSDGSSITLPKYEVSGDYSSTTLSISNANTLFNVGDTVLFTDGELQGTRSYRFVDAARVIDVTSSTITIDNKILNDKLLSTSKLYAINFSKINQYHSSNFDKDLYLASDVYVHDITIEMAYPDTGSGMYALYINSIDSRFENIKMNNVTTTVGSNAFIRSIINNVTANYYGGIMDMAEVQIRSTYSNLDYKRVGHNSNHQNEGFSINNGYLAHVYNVNIDNLDMPGAFRAVSYYDITYENCSYKTTSEGISNASWMFMLNPKEYSTTIINCTNNSPLKYTSVNNLSTYDSMNNTENYDTTTINQIPRLYYDGNAFYTSKTKSKTSDYIDKSVIYIIDDVKLNDSNILDNKLLNHLIYSEDNYTTTINDGIFDQQFFSIKDGTLIINGGTYYKPIYVNGSNAKVIINGGTFLANVAIYLEEGAVQINGGTFKNGVESINAQGGSLTINDGTLTSYGYSTLNINNAKVTMNKSELINSRVTSKYNTSSAILINSNQKLDKDNYLKSLLGEGKKMNDYELTELSSNNSYRYLSNKKISVSDEVYENEPDDTKDEEEITDIKEEQEQENPNTGAFLPIITIIIALLTSIATIVVVKQKSSFKKV